MSERSPLRSRRSFERVIDLKDRTLATFPVRVWLNFSYSNGFLLSAGMSYYTLFALFALLFVVFAGVGVWLGGSASAIEMVVNVINTYIPGLIATDGLFTVADVTQVARNSAGVLGITGAIAGGVALWTAVSAITFTRRAVRDLFGLPFDKRGYWVLKARDFFAAIVFGGAMLIGSFLIALSAWTLEQFFHFMNWSTASWVFTLGARLASFAVAFAIDAAALAMLVRFLASTQLRWRYIWPGALLGSAALVILQFGAGYLLSRVPGNPLLASFAVILGLLLWCRWMAIVILMAASFIAVTAIDHDQPLPQQEEEPAELTEDQALVIAATVHLRRADEAARTAPWYRRPAAQRAVNRAREELARATAEADSENVPDRA